MKWLAMVLMMVLTVGAVRFACVLVKELIEFACEAWHRGELES